MRALLLVLLAVPTLALAQAGRFLLAAGEVTVARGTQSLPASIGTAVAVTAPGIWLIKRRGRTLLGTRVEIELKALHRGNVAGGALFGIGWSIAGMCPGPILVNIGEGKVYALAALAGALVGAASFGALYQALQRPFKLPAMKLGTGEG